MCAQDEEPVKIQIEDPVTADVQSLLLEHLADMRIHSPPESVHALDIDSLRQNDITFWTVRDQGVLFGCGALKQLDAISAEIKSMKTANAHVRKGVARALLSHVIAAAKEQNLKSLLLETGSPDAFMPARELYTQFGFVECDPFAAYVLDPYSVFMQLKLS